MPRRDGQNIARYWFDPHLRGLSLMHADFHTQEFAPHRHEALVIAVTEIGGSVVKSRGVTEQADTSALFVFNPAEPHAGWMGASRHWRYRSLYLDEDALDEVARGLDIPAIPYFTRNLFADRGLIAQFLALHRAIQEGCEPLRERELLVGTFATLFDRHGSRGPRIDRAPRDRARFNAAREIVHARFTEPLLLDDLGRAAGLTEYQLIGLFKRMTGLTPHAYVTQVRLDAASRHLARGMPVGEVAAAVGFYDQSALNRHFKRTFAVTPLEFASAARKNPRFSPIRR